jgi:hypothetical protein
MKPWMLAAAGLVMAACETMPGGTASAEPARRDQFVALVEANGCRVDPADHAFIHDAGFSDAELADFSRTLAAQEWAEIGYDGALMLVTENCI